MRILIALLLCAAFSLAGSDAAQETVTNNKAFHARLLEIAKEYPKYGRVDDEARWAPWLCRETLPSRARMSMSLESETHGQKLYFLFETNPHGHAETGYHLVKDHTGQVVVKEAWIPKEVANAPDMRTATVCQSSGDRETVDSYYPYLQKDGKTYHAETKAALFIMYKLDPSTPGTDQGWVYGTVSPDAKEVTSAGRVASCMSCHTEAKYERLFGIDGKSKKDAGK